MTAHDPFRAASGSAGFENKPPPAPPSWDDFAARLRSLGASEEQVAVMATAWDQASDEQRRDSLDAEDADVREVLDNDQWPELIAAHAARTSPRPPGSPEAASDGEEAQEEPEPASDAPGGSEGLFPEDDEPVPEAAVAVVRWIEDAPTPAARVERARRALVAEHARSESKRRKAVLDAGNAAMTILGEA